MSNSNSWRLAVLFFAALAFGVYFVASISGSKRSAPMFTGALYKIAIKSMVLAIGVDDRDPLFEIEEMKNAYSNSEENFETLREVIFYQAAAVEVKKIAVKLSQCLPLERYLLLLDIGKTQIYQNNYQSEVVELLISPGAEWGTTLYLAYNEPRVRTLLEAIRNSEFSSKRIRVLINEVLSGQVADFIKGNSTSDSPLPVLRCQ